MKMNMLTSTDLTIELRARLAEGKAPPETRVLTGLLRSIRAELNNRAMTGDIPAAFALELGPETRWQEDASDRTAW